jgi:hypothetical protein
MNLRRSIVAVALGACSMAQAASPDLLVSARQLYNLQRYNDAITVATQARQNPALAEAAAVVLARAYFERFRQTQTPSDLVDARAVLRTVTASRLSPRDRVEYLIALGQSIYLDEGDRLDDRFSAAAEQFEAALARADLLDESSRDRLFEWWAGALDRQAQQGAEHARRAFYERILERAEQEVGRDDGAASATYWLAAAARGVGDLSRAIGAASAGWIRAGSLGARGESLREDLDRLMKQAILPDRAREITTEGDPRQTLTQLEGQWDEHKKRWLVSP